MSLHHYNVIMQGAGFRIETADGVLDVGFYAIRNVAAESVNDAKELAIHTIMSDLDDCGAERIDSGAFIRVGDVRETSWMRAWFRRPKGFTFYVLPDWPDEPLSAQAV